MELPQFAICPGFKPGTLNREARDLRRLLKTAMNDSLVGNFAGWWRNQTYDIDEGLKQCNPMSIMKLIGSHTIASQFLAGCVSTLTVKALT